MQKVKISIVVLFVMLIGNALSQYQIDSKLKSKKAKIEYVQYLVNQYGSGKVKSVVNGLDPKNILYYTDSKTLVGVLDDYSTIVHEMYHTINSKKTTDSQFSYRVNSKGYLVVNIDSCFKSNQLNNIVSEGKQDSIFRYGLYIGNEKNIHGVMDISKETKHGVASDVYGIFGILEEFFAYQIELESQLNIYPEIEKYALQDSTIWEDYYHNINGTAIAFYEFRLFCAWYLKFARENHPIIYAKLQNNKPLRAALSIVLNEFSQSISEYEQIQKYESKRVKTDFLDKLTFTDSEKDVIELIKSNYGNEYMKDTTFIENDTIRTKSVLRIPKEFKDYYQELKSSFVNSPNYYPLLLFHVNTKLQINYLKSIFTDDLQNELSSFIYPKCNKSNFKDFLE